MVASAVTSKVDYLVVGSSNIASNNSNGSKSGFGGVLTSIGTDNANSVADKGTGKMTSKLRQAKALRVTVLTEDAWRRLVGLL